VNAAAELLRLTPVELLERCRSMHYQPTLQKHLSYRLIASGLDGTFLLSRGHIKLIIRHSSCPEKTIDDSNIGILGKVPASVLALHPISLPCAVNDSLPARIFSSRMSQSGRWPLAPSIFLLALQDNRCSTRRFLADRKDLLIFERVETPICGFNIRKPD